MRLSEREREADGGGGEGKQRQTEAGGGGGGGDCEFLRRGTEDEDINLSTRQVSKPPYFKPELAQKLTER